MIAQPIELTDLNAQAVKILVRELGYAKAAIFLRQFVEYPGDYTAERQNQPDDLSVDELIEKIKSTKRRAG